MPPAPEVTDTADSAKVTNNAECYCGSGKKMVSCCLPSLMPLLDMNPKDKMAEILKGTTPRGNDLQGYPLELTVEARRYAAQLFTSNDVKRVKIVSHFNRHGKQNRSFVCLPEKGSTLANTVQFFPNMDRKEITYETTEAATEALVYALYKELCDQIPYENRSLPACLRIAGRDACTREEYQFHFEHLKGIAKTKQAEIERRKASASTAAPDV